MRCVLDLDGVLVDFVGGALRLHKLPYPYDKPENKDKWDIDKLVGMHGAPFWEPFEEEFWANLEWTPDGKDILSTLETIFGDDICILSKPTLNDGSAKGKIQWIKRNIPDYQKKFMLGHQKHFCANQHTILIDDSNTNIDNFVSHGGFGLLIPRPWNRLHQYAEHLNIVKYIKENLDFVPSK